MSTQSLLIDSTDSMIIMQIITSQVFTCISLCRQLQ